MQNEPVQWIESGGKVYVNPAWTNWWLTTHGRAPIYPGYRS